MTSYYWCRGRGDGFGKVVEVIEGLNNIIGDIMSFGCRWPDIVTLCVVAKKSRDNVRLVSTQSGFK